MAEINVKDMLEAGVHFGHNCAKWNPKMRPYIYGRRNKIHIIDIKETVRGLLRASKYLQKIAAQNSLILFVGTKRQASEPVADAARACGMPFVSERWLGGMLTNFRTIRSRLKRLEELEALETTGEINTYSKKRQSTLRRELKKVKRNLDGIRTLTRVPDCVVVIDPKNEKNCIHECRLLGVKIVSLIDTDSDPDMVDLAIPGNDDSIRSIRIILNHISDSVKSGRALVEQAKEATQDEFKAIPSVS